VLNWNEIFREPVDQIYFKFYLNLAAVPHQRIRDCSEGFIFAEKELRLFLMRFYVALNKINTNCTNWSF